MAEFNAFSEKLTFIDLVFMPISALQGDNVATKGNNFAWYNGPSLLDYLDTVHIEGRKNRLDFRFPVQTVIRPNQNFRGFAGQVASGTIRTGEEIISMPAGTKSTISRIHGTDGVIKEAGVGEAIVIELADEIDVSRGSMLMRPRNPAIASHRFEAMVCWMNEQPLSVGKRYKLLHTTREVTHTWMSWSTESA